jgi:hypothetical protein
MEVTHRAIKQVHRLTEGIGIVDFLSGGIHADAATA